MNIIFGILISLISFSVCAAETDSITEDDSTEYYQSQLNEPAIDCYKRNGSFECADGKTGEQEYFVPNDLTVKLILASRGDKLR